MLKPFFTAALFALALTAGCVDDSSRAALIEEAAMAIDNSDYASAVTILEGLCPDETQCTDEVLALLAQARMGLTGVDMLNLITVLEPGVGGADPTFVFDTLDAMFGAPPDGVTAQDIATLDAAIAALKGIDNPTAADDLNLALAAAAHLVASVMLAADPDNTGTWDTTTLTPAELDALAAVVDADLALLESSIASVEATLGGGTALTGSIGQLRLDLTNGTGGTVDATALTNYVNSL